MINTKISKTIVTFLILLSISNINFANIGQPYKTFWNSEFAIYFNLSEKQVVNLNTGGNKIKLEPGAEQKFIDINIYIDSSDFITKGELYLHRDWIKNNLTDAQDMCNSFMKNLISKNDLSDASTLMNVLKGDSYSINLDKMDALEVFIGERKNYKEKYDSSYVYMQNSTFVDDEYFLLQVGSISEHKNTKKVELEVNNDSLFFNTDDLLSYNLILIEFDDYKKVWTSNVKNQKISSIIDTKLIFDNNKKAVKYFGGLSAGSFENSKVIDISALDVFTDNIKIYKNITDNATNNALGFELKFYTVVFFHENIISKLFISGNEELTILEVLNLSQKSYNYIKK